MRKPPSELISLTPATNQYLPHVRAYATRAVWRRIAGRTKFNPEDERCQDLSVYLVFAVIGLLGRDRLRTYGCETTVIPVAFQAGHFEAMVTIKHDVHSLVRVTLAMPGESGRSAT